MSAANPLPQEKAPEPSMEEILASIRRIISDDQAPAPEEAEPAAPARADMDEVLDLAEVARVVRRPIPVPLDPPEIDFRPEPPPPPSPPLVPMPARRAPERLDTAVEQETVERLVSKDTGDSVGQAFQLLAHTVLSNSPRTLEDLVKDMLRPMLKTWLDDNLPVMVERLVRVEIERVARGR